VPSETHNSTLLLLFFYSLKQQTLKKLINNTNFLFLYICSHCRSKLASSTGTPAHNTLNSHTLNSYSNTLYSTAHSEFHKSSLERDRSK
jgi:hypothetical protein